MFSIRSLSLEGALSLVWNGMRNFLILGLFSVFDLDDEDKKIKNKKRGVYSAK